LTRFLFRNLSRAESLLLTAVVLTVTLTAACISIFF
jgi:outer membrane murein-binding lipoprotein Lpp